MNQTHFFVQTSFRNIKGTFDVLPHDYTAAGNQTYGSAAWLFVERRIREVFDRYDFREVRTPMFEPTEMIARGVGETSDIVTKEMFAWTKGDTNYVLRPELTAPIMRAYLQHRLDQQGPVQRLSYIGPCFRAERPARGRFRQFHQFGVEIIGSSDPRSDAEVVAVLMAVYGAFGIENLRLRMNTLGTPEERAIYKAALRTFLLPHREALSDISRERLEKNPLRILDTKLEHEQALLAEAPVLTDFFGGETRAFFDSVCGYVQDLGIPFITDPKLVRGLDYYAHTTFELESEALNGALAGAGRYDLLAKDFGNPNPVPAVGFAAGMERLFVVLNDAGYVFPNPSTPDVFLVAMGAEAENWVFRKAQSLRTAGIRVAFDLKGRSMKAQMREADRSRAPFVVIVGDQELSAQAVNLKNMAEGTQETIPEDRLLQKIQSFTMSSDR